MAAHSPLSSVSRLRVGRKLAPMESSSLDLSPVPPDVHQGSSSANQEEAPSLHLQQYDPKGTARTLSSRRSKGPQNRPEVSELTLS